MLRLHEIIVMLHDVRNDRGISDARTPRAVGNWERALVVFTYRAAFAIDQLSHRRIDASDGKSSENWL